MPSSSWSLAVLHRTELQPSGFGLYVHWPFCQSKCPYCDFNSHVVEAIDQARWADALAREIIHAGELTGRRRLDTVFFGGGTPSLMAPETVARVLDTVRATWPLANDWEVTLEANPTSVEAGRFAGYRQAGVNRVSLGVQSLNDDDLRRLGRLHSAAEARSAFDIARAEFDRVSFDLIYARQDQSLPSWKAELDRALEMAVDHLSLYQLTIEPGTAFGARAARGGLAGLPGEDLAADMYDLTVEACAQSGLNLYEISNFARPGAESKHNMLYWTGGDYAGVGAGAHGRLTLDGSRFATACPSAPGAWLERAESDTDTFDVFEPLSGQEAAEEYLMMGLRIREGVSLRRLFELGADEALPDRVKSMQIAGMLDLTGDRLRTTDRGQRLLNAVLRELLVG